MPEPIDRRALLKAFLGATLVARGLKALPPSVPGCTVDHELVPPGVVDFTMMGCPFEVGDLIHIIVCPYAGYYRVRSVTTSRVSVEYSHDGRIGDWLALAEAGKQVDLSDVPAQPVLALVSSHGRLHA